MTASATTGPGISTVPGNAQYVTPGGATERSNCGSCFGGGKNPEMSTAGGQQGATSEGCSPANGCFTDRGPGVMTYVGTGGGDYITETTYKYVGEGVGEFRVVANGKFAWGRALCCSMLVCLLVLVPIILLWPGSPTTTPILQHARLPPPTEIVKTTKLATRDCTFWGDPHLETFDGARPSFYGDGEFWVIKSVDFKVQGRYMGTKYTHGLAATHKIVISGEFIDNIKIEVGSLEYGDIEVNNEPVLTNFPSTYTLPNGKGNIRYDSVGELVDKAQSKHPHRIVHITLPKGVKLVIFRWKNYVDLKITSSYFQDMDGSCGNFNGDPMDDTTRAVFDRIGVRVEPGELLFGHREKMEFTPEMQGMLSEHCESDKLVSGELACRKQLPSKQENTMTINSCVFDYCFGMNEHALRTAKKYDD